MRTFPTPPSASVTRNTRRRSDRLGVSVTLDTVEAIGGFAALSHNADICQRHAVYLRSQDGLHARFTDRRDVRNTRILEATLAAVCELALVMTLASASTLSILRA